MISDNTQDLGRLEKAAESPELVVLSDWSHFTSEELHDVSISANIDQL